MHIFLLALITLVDFLLKSHDDFYFQLNVPEMSVTQAIIQAANSQNSHQKIRQKIVLFHPLSVEPGLVSNPFHPAQTRARREHDFSHTVASAAE